MPVRCASSADGQRALRQFAVQPESIADEYQRRAHRGAEIAHRLAEEFVQLGFVDSHGASFRWSGSDASIVTLRPGRRGTFDIQILTVTS